MAERRPAESLLHCAARARSARARLWPLLLAPLLVLTWSSSALAGTYAAFGPRQTLRDTSDTFSVRNPDDAFVLRIDNGGANGQFTTVSSAVVWLNGVQMPLGSFSVVEQPVQLARTNRLVLDLTGPPGSGVTVQVIGTDNTPPIITASVDPPTVAGWHRGNARVVFRCSDASSRVVTCPPSVLVKTEGANQVVTGTAVDQAGNSASASATVNVDKTPPVLSDFLPENGAVLPDPEINLAGGVRETGSGVARVTCRTGNTEEAAEVDDERLEDRFAFSCNLPLVVGLNHVQVQATDLAGNVSRTYILAVRHSPLPRVVITSPSDLSFSFSSPITVTGTVDDPAAMVTVNGVAASVANGTFTASVHLDPGLETVTAHGRNRAGSTSDSVRVVMIPELDPTLVVSSPGLHDLGDAAGLDFVVGREISTLGESVRVQVSGWVRDNALPFPSGQPPEVTVRFRLFGLSEATVTAAVSQGGFFPCLHPTRCWSFTATQEFISPFASAGGNRPNLTIAIDAHLDGRTSSRQLEGIVDYCIDTDDFCDDPSLCQPAGHRQNRRCIREADGCSNPLHPFNPNKSEDPTGGQLGQGSTAFGLDEAALPPDDPRRALTVFGQRRPVQLPCNRHDTCASWVCPHGTSRLDYVQHRLICDAAFYEDMKAVCRRAYPGRCPFIGCLEWTLEKLKCYRKAWLYYQAVKTFSQQFAPVPEGGLGLFDPPPQTRCLGCPTVTEDD